MADSRSETQLVQSGLTSQGISWFSELEFQDYINSIMQSNFGGYNVHIEPKWPLFWLEKALFGGVDLQK